VDRDRVEHALDRGAAHLALRHGVIAHALYDLEDVAVLAAIFV